MSKLIENALFKPSDNLTPLTVLFYTNSTQKMSHLKKCHIKTHGLIQKLWKVHGLE